MKRQGTWYRGVVYRAEKACATGARFEVQVYMYVDGELDTVWSGQMPRRKS